MGNTERRGLWEMGHHQKEPDGTRGAGWKGVLEGLAQWAILWPRATGVFKNIGTSLVIQWLGLHAFTAGGTGSIPGWGTKILQTTWCGQKKEKKRI